MKKINFEKLSNQELFSSFESNKLKSFASSNLKGGTSTTLCVTNEPLADPDSGEAQENTSDKRCTTY